MHQIPTAGISHILTDHVYCLPSMIDSPLGLMLYLLLSPRLLPDAHITFWECTQSCKHRLYKQKKQLVQSFYSTSIDFVPIFACFRKQACTPVFAAVAIAADAAVDAAV